MVELTTSRLLTPTPGFSARIWSPTLGANSLHLGECRFAGGRLTFERPVLPRLHSAPALSPTPFRRLAVLALEPRCWEILPKWQDERRP